MSVRVCVIYDCLFPWTVGGAERWYRQLAEAYAKAGHEVVYLTARQWDDGNAPDLPGVVVQGVSPRLGLYADGKRRIYPPLRFGWGVFVHLLRRGRRYDLIHTASFPYFSLLAVGLLRPLMRWRVAVDWHEVWSRDYWRSYLGPLGVVGWTIQKLCAAIPQHAFSFSRLHASRAEALTGGSVVLLEGEYAGESQVEPARPVEPPELVYAGRLIPEKRVGLLIEALAIAMTNIPLMRARIVGRGPEFDTLANRIAELGLSDRIAMPGFVEVDELEAAMRGATALVQPSEREGYGMVVVEAAARGVPVILVPAPDNAATELVEHGVNGLIARNSTPEALAEAIQLAMDGDGKLGESTRDWYQRNRLRLSFANSFELILRSVAGKSES